MKTLQLTILTIFLTQSLFGQEATTYLDKKGDKHLCGPVTIADLQQPPYEQWFQQGSNVPNLGAALTKWSKKLRDVDVEIYFGTWCGDSRHWVPRFISMWKSLGLKEDQLKLIALYGGKSRYKQGPNREEQDKKIHRVPTFVFKESGQEVGRIVESPSSDLVTDLAQVALGFPSQPNYKGATYLMNLLEGSTKVDGNFEEHLGEIKYLVGKPKELNTLGYVYWYSGRQQKALKTFYINTLCYPFSPMANLSYAKILEAQEDYEQSVDYYKKTLALDPDNEAATSRLKQLESERS